MKRITKPKSPKNHEEEGRKLVQKSSVEEKAAKTKEIIKEAISHYGPEKTVVAWTGGKDSTLIVYFVKQVCDELVIKPPKMMFIDEGSLFDEIVEFVNKYKKEWQLEVDRVHNLDVSKHAKKHGDMIKVSLLSEFNQKELRNLGFEGEEFPYEAESYVGNHLMKTTAMKMYLTDNSHYKAVITGIRWDEQEARANETYYSFRENPEHMRIHPILHLTEKDIWNIIHHFGIPYNPLYAQGYRSLGAKETTTKVSDKPAWEQDLDHTTERAGRRQDKEGLMKRLRALGYM